MKTALILCPPWDATYSTNGLAVLAASLAEHGHEAGIFDLNQVFARLDECGAQLETGSTLYTEWRLLPGIDRVFEDHQAFLESTADRILSSGHRVIGFSVYYSNLAMTLSMARLFKSRDPSVTIVLGGTECMEFQKCLELLRNESVDVVVFGEGDVAFPRFVDGLARSGRPEAGPGVLLRAEPGTWKPASETVPDLDALPFADFKAHRLAQPVAKVINTTRGCVRRCDFCSEWHWMSFRQMSGRRVHAEFRRQLQDHPGATSFFFGDSLINGTMPKLDAFCEAMNQEPLKADWRSYAIIRREMTGALLGRLRSTGCRTLVYGVQSGSEAVRKIIGNQMLPAVIKAVLADTRASDIGTCVTVIAGHPAEKEPDFQESLGFLRANAPNITLLSLTLFLASEFHGREDQYGLKPIVHDCFWESKDGSNTFPIRVERLRRLYREAQACGVVVSFDGVRSDAPAANIDLRCAALLERHRAWAQT
ncbi:MAG: B12-binding domain-containing radical SAM protein [Elusimicrobiota bacterium]